MLEVAAEERKHGRSTRIWSDDKFFENPQQMRSAHGAEPLKTSQLLDQMREGSSSPTPNTAEPGQATSRPVPCSSPAVPATAHALPPSTAPRPACWTTWARPTPASPPSPASKP
jgi:hypothetical protein